MYARLLASVLVLGFPGTGTLAQTIAGPRVQLLDAGTAPRELLRYRFEKGRSEQAIIEMGFDFQTATDGKEILGADDGMPPVRMAVILRMAEVDAAGGGSLEFEITEAGFTETGRAAVTSRNAPGVSIAAQMIRTQLTGARSGYRIDSRGLAIASAMPAPSGASLQPGFSVEAIAGVLQQLTMPLPAESVGVGARWQVSSGAEPAGTAPIAILEYTLRHREDQRIVIDMSATVRTASPTAAPRETKTGSTVVRSTTDFVSGEARASADLVLDRLVPRASYQETSLLTGTSTIDDGPLQRTETRSGVHLSIQPVSP